MKINKKCNGKMVELELVKIKDYPHFALYQVSRGGVGIYKTSLTKPQLSRLMLKKYVIDDEEDNEDDG